MELKLLRVKKMLKQLTNLTLPSTAIALGIFLSGTSVIMPAVARELPNGQSIFDRSPRLVRSAVNFEAPGVPRPTYQFTISVPEDAGAPLKAVTIAQAENAQKIDFKVDRSSAFIGNSFAGGPAVSLASIGGEQPAKSNEVTIAFEPPVAPGKTVTVALTAARNPFPGGIYLFGVTAFPPGENSSGLFLGYGRLHLDSD
jgi:hypothetical protein